MINVRVIAIDQRFVFGARGQQLQNFMVLELPGGGEVRAAIDEETVKHLMVLDATSEVDRQEPFTNRPITGFSKVKGNGAQNPEPAVAPPPTTGLRPAEPPQQFSSEAEFGGMGPEPVGATEAETIEWMLLPDSVLSPVMKAAFTKLEVEARLTPVQVRGIEREVNEKFGAEEWQEVLGPQWQLLLAQSQPQRAPQAPRPAPAVGVVTWADGSPMVSGSAPSRTIPKTDMGYPVLNDGTVDPGEVVGGSDQDEDGVGQL